MKLPINDGLDWHCLRVMRLVRKDFGSKKTEISDIQVTKFAKRIAVAYGINESDMLAALLRRGWFEPSAGRTYTVRWDKVPR